MNNGVYEHVSTNRGVGHTTLINDGAINAQYPFFMIGADMSHAKHLTRELGNRFAIPVSMMNTETMRGTGYPVLIDNYVFIKTCEDYIRQITDLKEEITRNNTAIQKKDKAVENIKALPFWMRLFKPLFVKFINRTYE